MKPLLTLLFISLAIANSSSTTPSTNATDMPSTNATEAPSTNATDAPSTNATDAPSTNATEGPSTNETEGPSTNATEGPSTNATEGPSTNATEGPSNNTTEAPPNTGSTPTSQVTSSVSSDPCQVRPCGGGAACVNLHNNAFCLCAEGYYYSTSSCLKGKTFPGEITVQVRDTTGLDNKNSVAYERLHDDIISFFQNVFGHSDYGQTVILQVSLRPSLSGRSEMRADMKLVDASVINILKENTTLTEKDVNDEIEKAVKKNNSIQSYNPIDSCEFYGCVKKDQDCSNSLQCECKPGLQRPNMLSPYCLPLECSANCSAEFNKQCIKKENKELQCVCLPDFQGDANDVCQACPFGYGGVDCKDQFQLILTIVGTIAAVLILALLISLVFFTRSKNKKSDIEEENLIDNDFQNLRLQSTSFSNLGADGNIFPKVRTTASKDLKSQNPYGNQKREPRPDY
uniref:mucin-13 n=1 Tax=Ictidomys tridecemlineatus TaxID=43179 RepID=UPI001A9DB45F|nr:mucin-13 [Ictidomys tridecemlineatus]